MFAAPETEFPDKDPRFPFSPASTHASYIRVRVAHTSLISSCFRCSAVSAQLKHSYALFLSLLMALYSVQLFTCNGQSRAGWKLIAETQFLSENADALRQKCGPIEN